jgi:hypothetical protein
MPDTSLPKPLSAYVGLLVASVEEARAGGHSTAGQVVRLPFAAAGQLLSARTRYDELAQTGDLVVDVVVGMVRSRFGGAATEAAQEAAETSEWLNEEFNAVKDRAATAKATTFEVAEEVAEKVSVKAADVASKASKAAKASKASASVKPPRAKPKKAAAPAPAPEIVVTEPVLEVVTEPLLDVAFEAVTEPPLEAVSEPVLTVAPEVAVEAVEPEVAVVTEPEPTPASPLTPMQQLEQFSVPPEIGKQAGGLKTAADLPLADFDHMSAPQLRGRLRKLDRVQLVQLLDYERAHADRVGIILLLENRLAKMLASGEPTV